MPLRYSGFLGSGGKSGNGSSRWELFRLMEYDNHSLITVHCGSPSGELRPMVALGEEVGGHHPVMDPANSSG